MACIQFIPQQKRPLKLETLTSYNEMLAFWEVAPYLQTTGQKKEKSGTCVAKGLSAFLFNNKTFPRKRLRPL